MNLDFLNQIEARLPEFSKAQKRIAHYILEHYEKAAFIPAVASYLFLSEVHFTPDFSFVPLHSHMFTICR